jgi:hypothetical protein
MCVLSFSFIMIIHPLRVRWMISHDQVYRAHSIELPNDEIPLWFPGYAGSKMKPIRVGRSRSYYEKFNLLGHNFLKHRLLSLLQCVNATVTH